ncbi:Glycogen accumulation regulator GarA [Anatilimnocola aggregata]|uniref:Glycogen accumulation regulator GarA n=1 Tax=Anatilimnocola aggregata TaxID=2528021 RepID=A0A517YCD8_9BACT|nr:FHA domain-containing protein [Anatilimnocola aggregata]QDU27849.1 Glycogen accumulation regulator GarA [Anatilimnocola aggregata]
MQVRFKLLKGSHAGKEVKLPAPKCLIGRNDDCHLKPQSEAVSRRHCVILTTDSEVIVRDLNSRNGTYVNGEKISGDTVLLNGDTVKVGPLEFEMMIEHTAARIKRPKVSDIKEAATRMVQTNASASSQDLSDVTAWLDEADVKARTETRQFRVDDTATGTIADVMGEAGAAQVKAEASRETAEVKVDESKRSDKKPPGKLPPRQAEKAKDSREAASDMLKKLFNRR